MCSINRNLRWKYGIKQGIFRVYFRTVSELEEITYRARMGEFVIYYRGKIVGGIYDNRLLVKPVKSAISYKLTAPYELTYDGAKEMLLVDEIDNKEFFPN